MKKRPIDQQFADAVRNGTKTTTIRKSPWLFYEPVMLYHWSGVPYRAGTTHVGVCAVVPVECCQIVITECPDGSLHYDYADVGVLPLWESEGFPSAEAMSEYFAPLVRNGKGCFVGWLMRFERAKDTTN